MKLAFNFMSLAWAEVISKAATFAAFAYVWRIAGPVGAGMVEFAASLFLIMGLLVDQGFDAYGAREIAKKPARTAELVSEIVFVRFLIAIASFAIVLVAVFVMDRSDQQEQLILVYCSSLFVLPMLLRWVFQGHEMMHIVAIAQVVRQGIFALIVVVFVRDLQGLWVVGAAELAGVTAAAVFFYAMYRRKLGARLRLRFRVSRSLIRDGVTIGLSQMFWSVRMFGATLLVGLVATQEDLGYFGVCMKILIALHAFVWLYYFNLLPSMSRDWHGNREEFHALVGRSMRMVGWIALACGAIWVVVSGVAIRVASGPEFVEATTTLQWLSAVCVLAAVNGHFRFGLIATGHQKAEMVTAALGAAVTLGLIPFAYGAWGTQGAAIALVVGEIVVWCSSWHFAHDKLGVVGHLRSLIRPLIAVTLVVLTLAIIPEATLPIEVIVVVVVMGVASLAIDEAVRERALGLVAVLGGKKAS